MLGGIRKLLATVPLLTLCGCLSPDCSFTSVTESVAPDQQHKVVIAVGNCGATTNLSTHASILAVTANRLSEPGNIFIADTDHGKAPSTHWDGPHLSAYWWSPNEVELTYEVGLRVFKLERNFDDIQITYRQTK